MNYVLGPMKCSGKPQPYPSEIEALNKKIKEQKFIDVVDQAEVNKKNLKVLDEKINSEAENITEKLENEIENVEDNLQKQAEEFKEQLKTLRNEMNMLRANFSKTINRVEKQTVSYFTGLTSRVDAQFTTSKGRSSISSSDFPI